MPVLRFLALAVAVVTAFYLVGNVAGLVAAQYERHTLGDQITERIAEVLPTSQQFVGPVADRVGAEATHTWTAQHCHFTTDGSGWVVVYDYRQVCRLESVHAWQVDGVADALALFGAPRPTVIRSTYSACSTVLRDDLAGDEGVQVFYIEPSAEDDRACVPTDNRFSERRPVTGELPDLDGSRGWLVVKEDIELVDEVIGCVYWTGVLCTNPFYGRPAWGDPA